MAKEWNPDSVDEEPIEEPTDEDRGNTTINTTKQIVVGAGENALRVDGNGIYLGGFPFASAPFRVDMTGGIVATSATITGSITATSGAIGGWTIGSTFIADNATAANANVLIDSANTLIRLGPTAGNYITLDGVNQRIRSNNYSAGVAGFTVEPTLIESENLISRGIMKGSIFAYDIISAIGGQLIVANADTLDTDMTALDASTMTVKGDAAAFAVNDLLVMRAVTSGGIVEEWFRVTNIASAPTYTVTRDLAGSFAADSNPVWKAGTPVVKQGVSDGASAYSGGWLRLFGEGTNSPFYSVFKRTGVAYNAYTEVARMGNLNGFLDYSSDEYGFAAGDSDDFFSYDPTNGARINTPVNVDFVFTAGEALTVGEAVGLFGEILQTESGINAGEATYVDDGDPNTNFDGVDLKVSEPGGNPTRYGLISFPGMAATPSGTGITVLKWEIKITENWLQGNQGERHDFHDLTASFDETTATWNNKPGSGAVRVAAVAFPAGGAPQVIDTGWEEATEAEYNNIRDHGMQVRTTPAQNTQLGDEDDATQPPKIEVRFTYKVQNGKVWKVKATTAEYANSFMGIAQSSVAAEASVKVRTEGKDENLSGLTPYADYFLSDTDGEIDDSAGTKTFVVGRALSATELQVKYSLNQAS